MYNPYLLTSTADTIRELFGAVSLAPSKPPTKTEIHPDEEAATIRQVGGVRELASMRWGFPAAVLSNRSVTNVRKLLSRFWRDALSNPQRRCLVPVNAFSEWAETPSLHTVKRRKAWFDLPGRPLFAFAGVWHPAPDGDRFAILTTRANAFVSDLHMEEMPMILAKDEHEEWLGGTFAEVCALSDAYPDSEMRILP